MRFKLFVVLLLAALPGLAGAVPGEKVDAGEEETVTKPGIPGPVRDFKLLPPPSASSFSVNAPPQGDLDLKGMALWTMNYLLRTPRPEENYQPVFCCWPLGCPPTNPGWDTIVDGDTDCRMDWEFYYMRDISGSKEGKAIEKAFHRRIENYVGKADLCWTYIGCYDMDPSPEKTKAKGLIANVWATTKVLKSLSLSYERHHQAKDKELARKLFVALRGLATWKGKDCAYFEGGMGPLGQDLKPARSAGNILVSGWGIHPPPIIEPLLCYWKATGDPEALAFAKAFAEGIMTRARPGNVVQVNPDGSFSGHMHATLHAMWGITRLGVETRDPKCIEFSRPIYDFILKKHSAFTGWIHEATTPTADSVINSGETCATSDMMSMVAWLAQADSFMPGQQLADYYDHLERYFRNYIAPTQFFITPQFEKFYRERHKDKPVAQVEAGLATLRKFEGGFVGGVGINDMMNDFLRDDRTSFAMQGCCVPEGMRALWTVWSNILRVETEIKTGHKTVYVNMSLPRESPEAKVISYLPKQGRLTVEVRRTGTFDLRPPAWAPRDRVQAWRGEEAVEARWNGAYVEFKDAQEGEKLTITYPLATYDQRVAIWPDPGKHQINPKLVATFEYVGNWATRSDPPGKHFPFYTGKLPPLPAGSALRGGTGERRQDALQAQDHRQPGPEAARR